ncbi:MarR family transcriptional regulator [Streptosporangiaceae bacterium NEAU-GS5]|nr:MarR family transcriptional regulator [Streptosporangiaceae bacterium NEAU-GS5]
MDERAAAEEIGRLYPAVYRRFKASSRPVGGTDLTPRMLSVLRHLQTAGPLTVGELAEHLGLSRAAATELVDRIEERGMVARIRDERDRRRVFVWTTEEGRAAVSIRVLEDDLLAKAVHEMTPEERQGLVDGLRALLREEQA